MSAVFLIVNEFQPIGSENPSMEIVSAWRTENEAWEELSTMAAELDAYIGPDDFDFSVEPKDHLEYDEYNIIEIEFGVRNGG